MATADHRLRQIIANLRILIERLNTMREKGDLIHARMFGLLRNEIAQARGCIGHLASSSEYDAGIVAYGESLQELAKMLPGLQVVLATRKEQIRTQLARLHMLVAWSETTRTSR